MKYIWLLFLPIAMLILSACSTEPEYNYIEYKIKVDSLVHPNSILLGDTLLIKFYGFVGPDGCHTISRFEEIKKPEEVEIQVWGKKPDFPTVCSAVIVEMRGTIRKVVPEQQGLFLVKVKQPDNSYLIDSVFVQ
ncbi:MAG: hypothetical protein IPM14_13210 [bacterium]|nr:hypothetical protein [bacterium]